MSEVEKKHFKNHIIAVVILLTFLGFVGSIFYKKFQTQTNLEITINIANRQIMLSQKIASLVAQYKSGDRKVVEELKTNLKMFRDSHTSLLKTYDQTIIPKNELREIYYGKEKALNNKVAIFINQVEEFIKLPLKSKKSNIYYKKIFAQANSDLMLYLDEVVGVYQAAAKTKLNYLFTLYILMFFSVTILIGLHFKYIFLPMIQSMKKYQMQLSQSQLMDTLTQIPNRKHFFSVGEVEVLRSRRFSRPLTILLLDIDYFKNFNEANGYAEGDNLVINVTRMIKNNMRTIDIVGRMEGGNFAILLPETNLNQAVILADRLRRVISAENIVTSKTKTNKITVSIGVAEVQYAKSGIEQAIKEAETNLYFAKEAGRNAVVPEAA